MTVACEPRVVPQVLCWETLVWATATGWSEAGMRRSIPHAMKRAEIIDIARGCDAARQPLLVENAMKCKLRVMTRIILAIAQSSGDPAAIELSDR
jgi:hypothetical protein